MFEKYARVKFETIFVEKHAPKDPCIKELISWCKKFSEIGILPKHGNASFGNLSARAKKGFIITCSGTDHEKMKSKDFAEVVSVSVPEKK